MRNLGVALLIFLTVTFLGGYISFWGAPVFARIDRLTGTDLLMNVHYGVFFFLYPEHGRYSRTKSTIDDFQQQPLGFDKKKKYKELDSASQY
jgi:hypothetical protein